MTLRQLVAVRHGESEGNVAREIAMAERAEVIAVGLRDPDVPLSARGRHQAAAVGRWIATFAAEQDVHAMWSSPYVRARQTAELALGVAGIDRRIRLDERLRDRELGVFDLLTTDGVRARFPAEAERRRWLGKLYYRPPGGESWADVALRLRSFLRDLDAQCDGTAIVFCHDAVIMLLRYVLEEFDERLLMETARHTVVANGSITHLVRNDDESWSLAAFDDCTHLLESGAPTTVHRGEVDDARL